jgi:hypothetical protein
MESKRLNDISAFLLKLMKERVDESKRLLAAGETAEVKPLVEEAGLLADGFDVVIEKARNS